MPKYIVGVTWENYGEVEIVAANVEDAVILADQKNPGDIRTGGRYVCDSWQVEPEDVKLAP